MLLAELRHVELRSARPRRRRGTPRASWTAHVLPTPEGPAKMNEPPRDAWGPSDPARVRRIALAERLDGLLLADHATGAGLVLHLEDEPRGLLLGELQRSGCRSPDGEDLGDDAPRRPSADDCPCRRRATASRARPCAHRSAASPRRANEQRPSRSPGPSMAPSLRPAHLGPILSSNSRRSGGAVRIDRRIRNVRAGLVDQVDGLVGQEPVGACSGRPGSPRRPARSSVMVTRWCAS